MLVVCLSANFRLLDDSPVLLVMHLEEEADMLFVGRAKTELTSEPAVCASH